MHQAESHDKRDVIIINEEDTMINCGGHHDRLQRIRIDWEELIMINERMSASVIIDF